MSRFLLAAAVVIGLGTPLSAQLMPHGSGRQPPVQPKQVDVRGTFEGVVRGGILLLDDKNQRWQVAFAPGATVHVTGTASADFLHSGLVVEFQAEIDNHGVAQAKVGELTVTASGKEKPLGLFPPGGAGNDAGDFGGQGGALGGNAGAAGKHGKSGRRQSPRRRHVPYRRRTDGPQRQISARAGHTTVQFELADEPKIGIDMADFNLVRKGDKVSIKGMAPPNRPGVAVARDVKIELAEPLTGPKKKTARPEAKPRLPKPDEGLPEPAGTSRRGILPRRSVVPGRWVAWVSEAYRGQSGRGDHHG